MTTKPYAVVTFIKEGTSDNLDSSEVPTCWLTPDFRQCWWPRAKNVGSLISKKTAPDINDEKKWTLYDITFEGLYDDLHTARQKADDLSSSDESSNTKVVKSQTQIDLNSLTTIKEENEKQERKTKKFEHVLSKKAKGDGFSDSHLDDHLASDDSDSSANEIISDLPKLFVKVDEHKLENNLKGTSSKLSHEGKNESEIANKSKQIKIAKPRVVENIPVSWNLKALSNEDGCLQDIDLLHPPNDNGKNISLPLNSSLSDYFLDFKSLSLQVEGITTLIIEQNQKVADKIAIIGVEMRNVSERLSEIERVLNTTQLKVPGRDNLEEIAALLPFKSVEEVTEFEMHITIGDIRPRLVSYLFQIGGNSAKECILRMLKHIFTVDVARKSSWCGQRENFRIHDLGIISAVKDAVRMSFACTDKLFEDEAKEWFRQGTQKYARITKKNNDAPLNVIP